MNLLKTSNATYYHPIYNRFPDRGMSRLSDAKGWYSIVESSHHPMIYSEDGALIASGLPLEEAIAKTKTHYVRKVFGVLFPPEIEKKGFEVWERGINFDGSLYNLVDSPQRSESLAEILGPDSEKKDRCISAAHSTTDTEVKERAVDDLYFGKKDLETALEFILNECDWEADPRIGEACRKALKGIAMEKEKSDSPAKRSFSLNNEEPLPKVAICCETSSQHGNIKITGSTYLKVIRVEMQDDGTIVAVTDHWPTDPVTLGKSQNRERELDMHLSQAHEKIVSLEKALKEQAEFNLEGIRKFEKMLQEKEDLLKEVLSKDQHADLKTAKAMGYLVFWATNSGKWIHCPYPSWKYPAHTYSVLVDGNHVRGDKLRHIKFSKK